MPDLREPTPPRRAPAEPRVRAMFDDIVERYDAVNTLLSLGLDRRWRRVAVGAAAVGPGRRILDLGCGTGDLSLAVARVGGAPVGVDVSARMLEAAARRADGRQGTAQAVRLVQGSAFRLPFADGAFDGCVSGFVLRNLHDLPGAFAELARVIRPGGRASLVDITEPPSPLLRRLFDAYFAVAAPTLGGLVGRRDAYRYLAASLAQLPPRTEVCSLLREAGFARVGARPLSGGMVTLFVAERATEG